MERAAGVSGAPLTVAIARAYFLMCGVGIVLHDADGLTVVSNQVLNCAGAGIDLDAASSRNIVAKNRALDDTPDVRDSGTGNCWSENEFVTGTVSPCP